MAGLVNAAVSGFMSTGILLWNVLATAQLISMVYDDSIHDPLGIFCICSGICESEFVPKHLQNWSHSNLTSSIKMRNVTPGTSQASFVNVSILLKPPLHGGKNLSLQHCTQREACGWLAATFIWGKLWLYNSLALIVMYCSFTATASQKSWYLVMVFDFVCPSRIFRGLPHNFLWTPLGMITFISLSCFCVRIRIDITQAWPTVAVWSVLICLQGVTVATGVLSPQMSVARTTRPWRR